jgi:cytochrome c biogenesis protein CcmG, thiol:disulfide interchange protein DsbE
MNKKKYPPKRKKNNNASPTIGIGLILVEILLFLFLTNNRETTAPASNDNSVIPVSVNYPAPQLSLQNIKGNTESLEEFRGTVLLVNNWATWCPPCKAEMPTLEHYYQTHAQDGFTIIAIEAGDGQDQVAQFANSLNLSFPIWLDPDGVSLRTFGNGNLPNSYVIDRSGTIRYAWTGEINLAMLEKYITPLIIEN